MNLTIPFNITVDRVLTDDGVIQENSFPRAISPMLQSLQSPLFPPEMERYESPLEGPLGKVSPAFPNPLIPLIRFISNRFNQGKVFTGSVEKVVWIFEEFEIEMEYKYVKLVKNDQLNLIKLQFWMVKAYVSILVELNASGLKRSMLLGAELQSMTKAKNVRLPMIFARRFVSLGARYSVVIWLRFLTWVWLRLFVC